MGQLVRITNRLGSRIKNSGTIALVEAKKTASGGWVFCQIRLFRWNFAQDHDI